MYQYLLTLTQLRDLRLHPSIWALIGSAHTLDALEVAKVTAEEYIQKHLLSSQGIQFGHTYALSNIRMEGIFVSQ